MYDLIANNESRTFLDRDRDWTKLHDGGAGAHQTLATSTKVVVVMVVVARIIASCAHATVHRTAVINIIYGCCAGLAAAF